MLVFFDKISAFGQTQFWKRAQSVWNLILCLTNKYCGQDRHPLFKYRYDMQDRNGFYWLVCFHCEYFTTQKLKDIVFQIKRHVWADIVLKSGCDHTENLLSEAGNSFYWLICFNFWKIRKSCFWSKIIVLSRYSFKNWARSVLKFAYFNIYA